VSLVAELAKSSGWVAPQNDPVAEVVTLRVGPRPELSRVLLRSTLGHLIRGHPSRTRLQCPGREREGGVVKTLVSDFDGTLTRYDFFRLALERLVPPGVPDYWQAYRAGRLTHFEAMRGYYAAIRATEAETLRVVEAMELEPDLAVWIGRLEQAGWKVV